MLYRTLGKTGLTVSALGFGAMRLPMEGDDSGRTIDPRRGVDEKKAIDMIEYEDPGRMGIAMGLESS